MSELPVGQSVQDVPRPGSMQTTLLKGLVQRLRFFTVRSGRSHLHDFARLARLSDPARDVFDCRCGTRRAYLKSGEEIESKKFLIDAGTITLDEIFATER